MSRGAVAILSTENLLHNANVIREKVKPAKVIAMVKANAYGHGIRSVAARLDGVVDFFGVASIDEALILRKLGLGIKTPIILMEGAFEPHDLSLASIENLHVVFHHQEQIKWLDVKKLPRPLQAWMKIDTGMGRLGFDVTQATAVYEQLSTHRALLHPINIMSHFGCADDKDHPLNKHQINLFNTLVKEFTPLGSQFSLCNSAGLFHFPQCHFDYVRPGLSLYGVSPILGTTGADFDLKPVMTLQTRLISVRFVKKGSSVGYGARFVCPEDMLVGIIAFGYGDGYPYTAQDGTPIFINRIKCGLIGQVSMDMIAIDLRNCPQARIGDPVLLWGEHLPLEEIVSYTAQSSWSLMTGVQHRVKFCWTRS